MKELVLKNIKLLKEIYLLPRINISFHYKDEEDKKLHRYFTKPHPRYKVFPNKSVGAALINLKEFADYETYLKSVSGKNSVAYYARRCLKEGFKCKKINISEYADEIILINTSEPERQGRAMDNSYIEKLDYPIDIKNEYFGVFEENKLVAYLWLRYQGEFVIANRLMGHADYLKRGVMYLLLASAIENLMKEKNNEINFVMYDTYFGASEGLKLFKRRFGFKPYFVKWLK